MKAAPVDEHLILLVKTTAELATQAKLSTAAAELLAQDLADLPREQVLAALRRCRRDGLKRLTVAAVISRLDDGRPAPDEAWTMLPKDERGSVVWCVEMANAEAQAQGLIDAGDWMAARVIFKEGYSRLVDMARAAGLAPTWTLRRGSDADALERALLTGIAHGRMSSGYARSLCPNIGMKSVPIYAAGASDCPGGGEPEDQEYAGGGDACEA